MKAPGFLRRAWHMRGEVLFYLPYALALGSLGFLNTWDMPIYLVVILLAYAAGKYSCRGAARAAAAGRTQAWAPGWAQAPFLLYIFFYLGFSSQAGGILPYIFPPTRLAQYLVMFGPFILILVFFVVLAAWQSGPPRQDQRTFPWKDSLHTWLWLASILVWLYLLALLAGSVLLMIGGSESISRLSILDRGAGDECAPAQDPGLAPGKPLAVPAALSAACPGHHRPPAQPEQRRRHDESPAAHRSPRRPCLPCCWQSPGWD